MSRILMLCGDYAEDYETMVPFQTEADTAASSQPRSSARPCSVTLTSSPP